MNLCLYGASSNEIDQSYMDAAYSLGAEMAVRGFGLVFGGGAAGLMGAAARGMSSRNGVLVGVAPSFFNRPGVLYGSCTELILTETMRERKLIMEERSGGFIMTPGAIGTFEEFFEILTLKQLGRHGKPIAIFNVRGYFDGLVEVLNKAIDEKFMTPECGNLYRQFSEAGEMLDWFGECFSAQ
ncbi:MAG: TIGR00730 family Rossman fold protein [Oscillospiraceae bacterium]|nr:TIGR00730 family Rossman fold protein [Oscillospiraceae bacterium]